MDIVTVVIPVGESVEREVVLSVCGVCPSVETIVVEMVGDAEAAAVVTTSDVDLSEEDVLIGSEIVESPSVDKVIVDEPGVCVMGYSVDVGDLDLRVLIKSVEVTSVAGVSEDGSILDDEKVNVGPVIVDESVLYDIEESVNVEEAELCVLFNVVVGSSVEVIVEDTSILVDDKILVDTAVVAESVVCAIEWSVEVGDSELSVLIKTVEVLSVADIVEDGAIPVVEKISVDPVSVDESVLYDTEESVNVDEPELSVLLNIVEEDIAVCTSVLVEGKILVDTAAVTETVVCAIV